MSAVFPSAMVMAALGPEGEGRVCGGLYPKPPLSRCQCCHKVYIRIIGCVLAESCPMESQIEQEFFQFLCGMGFPQSSIVYEPAFQPIGSGRTYRPDFALLDLKTNEPLAIIEIKGRNDPDTLSRAIQQVQRYIAALRDKAVRGYVVTPAQSGGGFNFYTPGEDGGPKQVPSSSFLNVESLSSARNAEKKEFLAEEKKETTDQFLIVCFCTAAVSLLISIADFISSRYGVTLLTTERMALIGAAIALVVIPFVQKFKGLGIEIDRAAKDSKK